MPGYRPGGKEDRREATYVRHTASVPTTSLLVVFYCYLYAAVDLAKGDLFGDCGHTKR